MIDLNSISANPVIAPPRLVVYGTGGVGKTTFAAQAPNPIIVPFEEGAGRLAVPKFHDPADGLPLLKTFQQGLEALQSLCNQQHDFKTVVVDSVDWLEHLVWKHTCLQKNWDDIEQPGYGKGYVAADDNWRLFFDWLQALRMHRGMGVILLAHNEIRQFEDPLAEPYDRYQLKLQKRAAALVQEWSDAVLFMHFKSYTVKDDLGFNKENVRAVGIGQRVLHTEERPAYYAKNRYGLPPSIEIPDVTQSYGVFQRSLTGQ